MTTDAALYNAQVLGKHYFNLGEIIQQQHPSQISYGSEFKPTSHLKELLSDHPL